MTVVVVGVDCKAHLCELPVHCNSIDCYRWAGMPL